MNSLSWPPLSACFALSWINLEANALSYPPLLFTVELVRSLK